MEETKEERIQRLVKEGIAEAKLNDKTSGKCFHGKKEPYRSDKPPTPPTLIGKPSKTWNTGENPPTEPPIETPKPFPILNVMAIVATVVMLGAAFAIMSPTFLSNLNYASTNSETRAEIFADASGWSQGCSNAMTDYKKDINNPDNKIMAGVMCRGYLDYLYLNREVLDSGSEKNLASNEIIYLEKALGTLGATGTSGGIKPTGTPILPMTGTVTGTWVGNYEMRSKTVDPKLYTGNTKLILKQNGNRISASWGDIEMTGNINSNKINFDDGFMFFSGNLVATNVLNLNAENCLDADEDGYCVDSRLVGTSLGDAGTGIPAGYDKTPGQKFIMTLTRQ